MNNTMKWITAVFTIIAALWGGMITLDDRYARAGDVRQQVDGLKALYLQQQVTALEREEFELNKAAHQRRLSDFEDQRLNAVRKQLDYLKSQLRGVAP